MNGFLCEPYVPLISRDGLILALLAMIVIAQLIRADGAGHALGGKY
jgi:hypothetical protein